MSKEIFFKHLRLKNSIVSIQLLEFFNDYLLLIIWNEFKMCYSKHDNKNNSDRSWQEVNNPRKIQQKTAPSFSIIPIQSPQNSS